MGLFRHIFTVIALFFISAACRAVSLTVWPVDPQLVPPSTSTAFWVRNTGKEPVMLQARVYRWNQELSKDNLVSQDEVAISPPMIQVAGQGQQLFRIVHRSGVPNYREEQSYRILIDEIPDQKKTASALQFQMRYSLPFFIFPQGYNREIKKDDNVLNFWIANPKNPTLTIVNHGNTHFRLSQVYLVAGDSRIPIAEGLLGYVLPKSTMSWTLPLDKLTYQQRQDLWRSNYELIFVQNHHQYRVARSN